ncbi:hypothetical protein L3081_11215 [Colwellia sp. MSW7]|jgi:hypothetical protein|uniref:Uncharacterized protein n=1 Tax=Colwellia maritima TaxID=2912588 RepID=A0ABS9X0T4_9GAMM|nr:hypothetical protein [Colwellia maritima]MCI2283863.1 hypothetical protein [Colwellia maritima]
MKYINDLTYLSHIAQTKQLVKDKKQKNKYRQTVLLNDDSISENEPEELVETTPNIEQENIEQENDRRAGNDRRKEDQDRGRYVESRLNKNRRHKKELRIII